MDRTNALFGGSGARLKKTHFLQAVAPWPGIIVRPGLRLSSWEPIAFARAGRSFQGGKDLDPPPPTDLSFPPECRQKGGCLWHGKTRRRIDCWGWPVGISKVSSCGPGQGKSSTITPFLNGMEGRTGSLGWPEHSLRAQDHDGKPPHRYGYFNLVPTRPGELWGGWKMTGPRGRLLPGNVANDNKPDSQGGRKRTRLKAKIFWTRLLPLRSNCPRISIQPALRKLAFRPINQANPKGGISGVKVTRAGSARTQHVIDQQAGQTRPSRK